MLSRRVLFTGIQPSGSIHIGNFIGALGPFWSAVKSGNRQVTPVLMIADLHAMTSAKKTHDIHAWTVSTCRTILGCWPDADILIFRQSKVMPPNSCPGFRSLIPHVAVNVQRIDSTAGFDGSVEDKGKFIPKLGCILLPNTAGSRYPFI